MLASLRDRRASSAARGRSNMSNGISDRPKPATRGSLIAIPNCWMPPGGRQGGGFLYLLLDEAIFPLASWVPAATQSPWAPAFSQASSRAAWQAASSFSFDDPLPVTCGGEAAVSVMVAVVLPCTAIFDVVACQRLLS